MKFICYGSLTWLIQLERELFSLEFCIYIWYKITRGIFNVTTREMSFMRLKHSYHDKGIRNLCKWNFWTFHIGKDREDCVTWSHFFKKKLLIFQLVCWDFIRTCEVSIDLRATSTEIMNGPATHWPIYFPGNAYYVFSSNLTCLNFETKLGSKSLEQVEDNERLKFTLVFAWWYLENRKSYRDEWKSVLKGKTLLF